MVFYFNTSVKGQDNCPFVWKSKMDHYKTLGVDRSASPEQIKQAYRKLAMQHHPDRNGDENQFKKINEAYDVLSNAERKQEYDNKLDAASHSPFGSMFDDPFEFFKSKTTRTRQNLTAVVEIELTLLDVLSGKKVVADINLPSGNNKTVTFTVPAGVYDGQQVRYPNIGDDTFKDSPAGDLIVRVKVAPHATFIRENEHLICVKRVSVFDVILGTQLSITTIDNRTLTVTVPPGSQPSTLLSCKGEGLPTLQSTKRGNLYIKLDVVLPVCNNSEQRDAVLQLKELFKE